MSVQEQPVLPELLGHEVFRQLVRFGLVGMLNTALNLAVYVALLRAGAPYVLAAPMGFITGAVMGYWLNRRWTFSAADSVRARILYALVLGAGAACTSLLVLLFVRVGGAGKLGAYLASIPPVTLAMFAANRRWTFAERS